MDQLKKKIDDQLAALINQSSSFFPSLYEGAQYALLAPGKRIRPLLTLCAAEMLQPGAQEVALTPACALEMVHTYSLIHDDLPCMDDDDFRRGQPTLHKVYTEGHAVLMGDYLLTYAFETLANAPYLSHEQKIALICTLSSAAGGHGMIGGQVMDIEDSPHIEHMHTLKTAALFRAALRFGGIIAESSSDTLSALDAFAIQFGKLFQIIDDLQDDDHPLGSDQAEKKAHELYHSTLSTLDKIHGNPTPLLSLTQSLFSNMNFLKIG